MSLEIRVKCKLCDNEELFEDADEVNDSMWEEVSPLGTVKDGENVHRGYCPDHSLGNYGV